MVYFCFEPSTMANEQENAQIKLTEAQEQQARVNTLLSLVEVLGNELVVKEICAALDLEYEAIKNKLPDPDEAVKDLGGANAGLGEIAVDE